MMEVVWKPVRETVFEESSMTDCRKAWLYKTTYKYNDSGNLVKEVTCYSGYGGRDETEYSYDPYGRRIGEKRTEYDAFGRVTSFDERRWIYKPDREAWRIYRIPQEHDSLTVVYDGRGRPIMDYYGDGEDGSPKSCCDYFDEGSQADISMIHHYSKGELIMIEKLGYDADGRLIWKQSVNPDGQPELRYTYQYDNQGEMIERTLYDRNRRVLSKSLFKIHYDENGNKVYCRLIHCESEGPISITHYETAYGLLKQETANTIHLIDPNYFNT